MKPEIIYEPISEDGIITFTKKRFEELMEQFYQAGLADGRNLQQYTPYWGTNTRDILLANTPSIQPINSGTFV